MGVTIGVHTHVTNPISSGYLAYLACIESWARIADELVVVDGGSEDDSLQVLLDWLGPLSSRVKVILPSHASWGAGDRWYWPQIAINRHTGFEELHTDWAIHVDADHVLQDNMSREAMQDQLHMYQNAFVADFWVSAFEAGVYQPRLRKRSWIVNKRKLAETDIKITYGIDEVSQTHLDYPIHPRKAAYFLDPSTSTRKSYWIGDLVEPGAVLDIECVRYGHFFFTGAQCLHKCKRLDKAVARYVGRAPSHDLELSVTRGLLYYDEHKCFSKDAVMSWPHPDSVKRVLAEFYQPGMLGGLVPCRSFARQMTEHPLCHLLRMERYLRTQWMRVQGYRGLKDLQQRVLLGAPDPEPLDVRASYMWQDGYLPPQYRIDWSQSAPPLGAQGG